MTPIDRLRAQLTHMEKLLGSTDFGLSQVSVPAADLALALAALNVADEVATMIDDSEDRKRLRDALSALTKEAP